MHYYDGLHAPSTIMSSLHTVTKLVIMVACTLLEISLEAASIDAAWTGYGGQIA
jgi:hypothetical protein